MRPTKQSTRYTRATTSEKGYVPPSGCHCQGRGFTAWLGRPICGPVCQGDNALRAHARAHEEGGKGGGEYWPVVAPPHCTPGAERGPWGKVPPSGFPGSSLPGTGQKFPRRADSLVWGMLRPRRGADDRAMPSWNTDTDSAPLSVRLRASRTPGLGYLAAHLADAERPAQPVRVDSRLSVCYAGARSFLALRRNRV